MSERSKNWRRFSRFAAAAAIVLLAAACGRKADPQPADLVRPEAISDLAGQVTKDGVRLVWTRPDDYVNGDTMDDLGGFLVFRGAPGALADEIADIPVGDRDRFRRQKKFDYVDKAPTEGRTYYYRIVSYTTDRYYSTPSNQATLE